MGKIEVIEIKNWTEFTNEVFRDCYDKRIDRDRSSYVFRGATSSNYGLEPSLNVKCGHELSLEESLIRNFKKYASLEIRDKNNIWEILTLAQHHGLPTRLLDWTFSPYVAAHFATENVLSDENGAVWCINIEECRDHMPQKLKAALQKEGGFTFGIDFLNEQMIQSGTVEERLMETQEDESSPYVLFLEPPSIDSRIVNQYALFSVMSARSETLSDWIEKEEIDIVAKKIIIPPQAKKEIRDKLDQININERVIYPGLDGLCQWLVRHYMDSGKMYSTKKK
ncbi:FRG domain-containing protein [Enterococcus caccae]|uniref:FRG domain-containing protein n=1 Tax=Enterococcus caccae ATCC BAA-1240 TaxID=1158612 RepID=R3WAV2_9ENTE|nr:FRG domain-containing protein [Enterococcus caccae]EOL44577.1 hypothetical protein UC7_02120 [Enterococcus caccae ATCC BAA-1240]EOT58720.1 hypothetical protein I580_02892 [Enterococcus caccae ATCC BAA-1240]OJG25934.1 hypothetical protein RU98_GL000811 [Enterococcus caccae]